MIAWQASLVSQGQSAVKVPRVMVWSASFSGELFVPITGVERTGLEGRFGYDTGDFLLLLTKSLYYDSSSDYFFTSVGRGARQGLLMLRFQCGGCRGNGLYRTVNGPELTLNDLGSLKLLKDEKGLSVLFTQVGDGEWRPVAVTRPDGGKLLIEYGREGLISEMRDSESRSLTPVYKAGRLDSVYQTWTGSEGKISRQSVME